MAYYFKTEKKHTIDLLFPIALFFGFALCAVVIILFATGVYRRSVEAAGVNAPEKTAMAYVEEKIHQNDNGGVYLTTLTGADGEEGIPALVLETANEEVVYQTYIYCFDGSLREMPVREGTEVHPESGNPILELSDLTMEAMEGGRFRFTAEDAEGHTASRIVAVKSDSLV